MVHGVERDDLARAGDVFEPGEHYRLALLRRQLLQRGDDAADGDDLAVAAALELVQHAVGLAAELVADRGQRGRGVEEAERLFFQLEQVIFVEFVARRYGGMVPWRLVAGHLAE